MDIVCFSHLRWDFVYQRPQHILSRLSKQFRVLFVEEPVFGSDRDYLETSPKEDNIWIIRPHLQDCLSPIEIINEQVILLKKLFQDFGVKEVIGWYYTPMALSLKDCFNPKLIVFDCMDELSAFKNAPPDLRQKEQELMAIADIVFTGGFSLYEAKKDGHHNIFMFPSSIDKKHFNKARLKIEDVPEQRHIPHPRIGFFGVVDERMDIRLLNDIAVLKSSWQFIIIGPVVKIDAAALPSLPNIHYLGSKSYKDLPNYIAGWDVAIMPFAMNESTRYISPTKTPEYLAAGKPVVSTPIHDVVKVYGKEGLVYIAGNTKDFINAIQRSLDLRQPERWLKAVDSFLQKSSWDSTCEKMLFQINLKLDDLKKMKGSFIEKEDEYV